MERREGREDRGRPRATGRRRAGGSATGRPAKRGAEHLRADDRLREDEREEQNPAPKSQCAISARGSTRACARVARGRRPARATTRENRSPTSTTRSGGWTSQSQEALAVRVEERHPVGLGERPDDSAEHGQRPERLDCQHPEPSPRDARFLCRLSAGGNELVHDGGVCLSSSLARPNRAAQTRCDVPTAS